MLNEPVASPLAEDDAAWVATMAVAHCGIAVPTEDAARSVADALRDRGHRWITTVPLQRLRRLPKADHLIRRNAEFAAPELADWWHVGSLVDEQAPIGTDFGFLDSRAEYFQAECERAAIEALARNHRGFAASGWSSLRQATFAGDAPPHAEVLGFIKDWNTPAPELFDLSGLVHEVDQEQAFAVRPTVIDVGFWFEQSAVYQDACFPHSADAVPLLAGVAVHDDVEPEYRVRSLVRLFEAATLGRRRAALEADRRRALGSPMDETDDEQALRLAVEASAAGLFERWDQESEAAQVALAALAAACPTTAQATGAVTHVRGLTDRWTDESRVDAMRFALALADDDPEELTALLDSHLRERHLRPSEVPSPYAPARGALLESLWGLIRAV